MTRPTVATVLSARAWEPQFCDAIHRTALARLVARVFEPIDLSCHPGLDWVVVGAETAWFSASTVAALHDRGISVVGVHADDDPAGAEFLTLAGADLVVGESTDPVHVLRCLQTPTPNLAGNHHRALAVIGPRGAGVTTVAIGLGTAAGATAAIIDTDEVPGVGPALGLPPPQVGGHPFGEVRVGASRVDGVGPTVVTLGAVDGPLSLAVGTEVVRSARSTFSTVVVDAPPPFDERVGWCVDEVVLVLDAGVQGLLRGMAIIERWSWPTPHLVINRVDDDDVVLAARRTIGLDPAAVIPLSPNPMTAATRALADLANGEGDAGPLTNHVHRQ